MSRANETRKSAWRATSLLITAAAIAGLPQARAADAPTDWASYNRTLTSERYVPFDQINRSNVAGLKQVCVYDLNVDTSFQTGPLVIGLTLYGTTDTDTFAIDAGTCAQKWRGQEENPSPPPGQPRARLPPFPRVPRQPGR